MPVPPQVSPRPLGATVQADGVAFRVWAPAVRGVQAELAAAGGPARTVALAAEAGGHFSGWDPGARPGDRYWFRIDGDRRVPDPASRAQPDGCDGPSQIVDPGVYQWRTAGWSRPAYRGRVLYELHVGTFTPAGTFRAAADRLPHLAALGVNTIELMPLHEFPGRWNWGYDAASLFAPAHVYGPPDDLRGLVDAAHAAGLAVVLDVVYNHFSPTGNYLPLLAPDFFRHGEGTGWGSSIAFDGPAAEAVRGFYRQNVAQWLDEYRLDGLRLDATHAMEDRSQPHILAELAQVAQARGAFVIAEDERNLATLVRGREAGGEGLDGVWADDFHHTVKVACTGIHEGYFRAFRGDMAEWVRTLRAGWLYAGQRSPVTGQPRGSGAGEIPPERFVHAISNHDQVGNRALGERLGHELSPAAYRAVSALLCLTPYTPLLFMGQEWAATTPFLYFSDHAGELGRKMAGYRAAEFRRHDINTAPGVLARMPDPQAETTFAASRLRWEETEAPPGRAMLEFYRQWLRLRAEHPVFQNPGRTRWAVHALGTGGVALRWADPGGDWLLVVELRETPALDAGTLEFLAAARGGWRLEMDSTDHASGTPGVVRRLFPRGDAAVPAARLYRDVPVPVEAAP